VHIASLRRADLSKNPLASHARDREAMAYARDMINYLRAAGVNKSNMLKLLSVSPSAGSGVKGYDKYRGVRKELESTSEEAAQIMHNYDTVKKYDPEAYQRFLRYAVAYAEQEAE